MTMTTNSEKSQDAATILSGLAVENPPVTDEGAADDLANYLPGTLELAAEVSGTPEYIGPLLAKLKVDPIKHRVPLVRVLEPVIHDLLDDFDSITGDKIDSLRAEVEDDIKSSRLSKKEKADLAKHEAQIDQGLRQSAEALKAIRDGRLYREEFSSWDGYCTARWQFSGTSGDNKITWLNITELLEEKCGVNVTLGVVQAKELLKLEAYPELLVDALIAADEKAKTEGRKRKDDDVRAEVGRRLAYVRTKGVAEAMSLAEFEALIETGIPGFNACSVIERVREKETEGLSFGEALDATDDVAAARTEKKKAATESQLRTVKAEIRTIKEDSNLQQLLDQEKSLKDELATLNGDLEGNRAVVESEVEAATSTDESTSDVSEHLKDALESLNDALDADWPEDAPDELDQIRVLAEQCEDKLAEFTARVKEALADADEPVAVAAKEE